MRLKKKIIRATTVPISLETFCEGVLRKLSEKYEVVGLSSPGDALERVAEREGVRTIAVPMERHIFLIKDIVSLWRMVKIFRKERPDMVHSMTPKAGLLCMLAAWITRVPVRVHTFTGLVFPTSTGLKRSILMMTDWLTCACATHVIPEGEGVKNDLMYNGITKKPLRVLGYGNVRGVDMDFYSRRNAVLQKMEDLSLRDESRFTFLFVGRIVRDKGIDELVKSFLLLNAEIPSTRLLLVGRFEDDLDPVSDETRRQIDESTTIECVGSKYGDELLAYYAAADCFVFPSYREGFPNTVLEAGAMGLPCIVTDINGSREIVIHGENGIIIPLKDENALYDAMEKIMVDNSSYKKMAANARRMIETRYEQGYVRKCLFDYYDEILRKYK